MDEIKKAQKAIYASLVTAQKKLTDAEKLQRAAEAAVETARTNAESLSLAYTTLKGQYDKFVELFPFTVEDEAQVAKPATKRPQVASSPSSAKKIPLVDAISQVMGAKSMRADAVVDALKAAHLEPNSNNPRGYISSVLSSAVRKSKDSEGNTILANGEPVMVHVFEQVQRGLYRVAREEHQDVVMSTSANGAEALLESQGLAAPQQQPQTVSH